MAATSDIIALAKEKLTQIAKLQGELDELRHLLNSGGGESHRIPGSESAQGRTKHTAVPARQRRQSKRRERAKRPDSTATRAETILAGVGHPLHVNNLLEKIDGRFGGKVAKQTLVSSLSRLVKTGERFVRTGPNTFGLIGMEKGTK